jgi:hypothetical protein
MKRITAILLAMVLMLSACAAPSGDSGENSAGGGSSAAQAETEQDAGSSAAQAEAAQGTGGEEAVTNAGRQPLVILEQQDEDYRAIDAACRVLYGADNRSGLYALVGWPADAIYHHYLALRTWEDTASMLGYPVSHVKHMASAAMELADTNGQMWTELGRGLAE